MIFYEKLNSGQFIKRTRQKFSFAKFEGCGWHWLESVQLLLFFFAYYFSSREPRQSAEKI